MTPEPFFQIVAVVSLIMPLKVNIGAVTLNACLPLVLNQAAFWLALKVRLLLPVMLTTPL